MDIIRTLGVAIDPDAAKSGGAAAAAAFKGVGQAAQATEKATTAAQKSVDATGKSMGGAKRAGDLLRETLERQNTILSRMDSSLKSLTAMLARKKTALDAAAGSANAMGRAAKNATDQVDKLAKGAESVGRSVEHSTAATNVQTASLQRLALTAGTAVNQLRLLNGAALAVRSSTSVMSGGSGGGGRGGAGGVIDIEATPVGPQLLLKSGEAAKVAANNMGLLYSQGSRASSMWRMFTTAASGAGGVLRSVASNLAGTTARLAGQYGVVGGVVGTALVANGVLNTATNQDRAQRVLKSATGDQKISNREMAYAAELTERLGLEYETTTAAYAKFVSVGRLSKLTYQEIRDTFEGVANASATMGLTAEESSGAILALTQMLSKGRVTGEELNQQLAERIPGAVKLMADSLGVGTAELNKMMAAGQLAASDVLPKFGAQLTKQFGKDAASNAQSTTGAINQLKNAWTGFKLELIEFGIVDILKAIMNKIVWAVQNIKGLIASIRVETANAAQQLSDWKLEGATKSVFDAIGISEEGFKNNPLVRMAMAAKGLVAGVQNFKFQDVKPVGSGSASTLGGEDAYDRMAAFKVRPSGSQDFRAGLYNSGKELASLNNYTTFDSVTGQLEKHMGQLEKAGQDTAGALASNFTDMATSMVTSTGNALDKIRNMLSSLAKDIAAIFVRRAIAEPIAGAISMGMSGFFGGGAGAGGAAPRVDTNWSFNHTGGIVGMTPAVSRMLPSSLLASAPRFHSGLKHDEFPTILQRGEEVIPKNQVGKGGGDVYISVTVDGSKGGTQDQNQKFGEEVARQIEAKMDERIARAMMPRGILWRAGG